MAGQETDALRGKRILIVEDEYIIASDLACAMEEEGAEVIGPAGSVERALEIVEAERRGFDAAVLDVNLRGRRVYPVADALTARGIPFVFATGYDWGVIPDSYAGVPRCEKPVDKAVLARLVAGSATPHERAKSRSCMPSGRATSG